MITYHAVFDSHLLSALASTAEVHKESKSHVQNLGAGRVAWGMFRTGDPQLWSDICISLCAATDVCMSGRKTAVIILILLLKAVQNLVAWLTRRPVFAHPYSKVMSEVMIHPLTINKHTNSELSFIVTILTRLEVSTERNPSTRWTCKSGSKGSHSNHGNLGNRGTKVTVVRFVTKVVTCVKV